jgi:SnoaL-like domain
MDAGLAITRYLNLVGAHDLAPLDELFADDLVATTSGASLGKAEWIVALRRLLPVLVRNDIRRVFVDGDDACAIYDFVTDTEAGAVPCVEWITVTGDRISRIELIFEKANWAHVAAALQVRPPVG